MRAMNTTVAIICCIAALIVGAAVSGVIFFRQGIAYRQKQAESIMGSAEKEAEKILADADKEAESKKKTALVEAKDEIHKLRSDAEKEIKDRRYEISRQERRIQQKEESLDKKNDNLERKEETLQNKIKKAESYIAFSFFLSRRTLTAFSSQESTAHSNNCRLLYRGHTYAGHRKAQCSTPLQFHIPCTPAATLKKFCRLAPALPRALLPLREILPM